MQIATRGDALRLKLAGVESQSMVAVGAVPGLAVLAVAGRNGVGVGILKVSGSGTGLAWKAPGSASFGHAQPITADGSFLLEDGDDSDKWIRVAAYTDYLSDGEGVVYVQDKYNNEVGQDDVTAAEASAGDVTDFSISVHNDSHVILSQVKFWLDASVSGIEISDDDITYVSPTTEGTALAMADIPAGGSITLYVRRTIGAGASSDADILNILECKYSGI